MEVLNQRGIIKTNMVFPSLQSAICLSGAKDRSPWIFGVRWQNHWEKIRKNWEEQVASDQDIILLPGDISWAMKLADAEIDLDSIGSLPGRKIMIKGNHDYWWSSLSKVRSLLPPSVHVLQNDSLSMSGFTFCGTRGWNNPGMKDFTQQDAKVYSRKYSGLSFLWKVQ